MDDGCRPTAVYLVSAVTSSIPDDTFHIGRARQWGKILTKVPNDAVNSSDPPAEQIKMKEQFLGVCYLSC